MSDSEDPISTLIVQRQRQRHQIPPHLYKRGNKLFSISPKGHKPTPINLKLQDLILEYPFDTTEDPLVLFMRGVFRGYVYMQVYVVMNALLHLNSHHQANHTLDWWYQPIGQAKGHALIAIRPNGLYELVVGEEEV